MVRSVFDIIGAVGLETEGEISCDGLGKTRSEKGQSL